jgi:hypothetical protein
MVRTCSPFARPHSALLALTALAIAPLFGPPAVAAPPGYERLMMPHANSRTHTQVSVPNWIAGNLNSDIFGTKGFRPVDVEINTFAQKINHLEDKIEIWHEISFVEVENTGPLQEMGWVMDLATTPEHIQFVLENVDARPIDLELYFRSEKDIDGTVIVPRCACIWVPNGLYHASPWDFIPPMPEVAFYNELNIKYAQGWRPYDVEFAVDFNGQVFGTALLAPVVSLDPISGTQVMDTQWDWFTGTQLAAQEAASWQLLDFEYPPLGAAQDPLIGEPNQWKGTPVKFCVLVRPLNPAQFPPTETQFEGPGNQDFVHETNDDLFGLARLIDLEVQFFKGTCKKGLCEGDYHGYEGVWLFP